MDEVDGIEVVQSPKREEIQEICQKMCSWERYIVFLMLNLKKKELLIQSIAFV